MFKFAIPALAASLALAACGDANTPAEAEANGEAAMTASPDTGGTTVVTPTATETVVVDDTTGATVDTTGNGSSVTIDGRDVDATVGEDGVKAKIKVN